MSGKCLVCGFEINPDHSSDMVICKAWAHNQLRGFVLPTKVQFEAMQREGFLPKQAESPDPDGKPYDLNYRHYGWAVDYDWGAAAIEIIRF